MHARMQTPHPTVNHIIESQSMILSSHHHYRVLLSYEYASVELAMSGEQKNYGNITDKVFITSAIIFNLLVSAVYLLTKFDNMELVKTLGYPFAFLLLPFSYTLYQFKIQDEQRRVVISNIVILAYLFLELLLDTILVIPFREILWLHVVYIVVFYAAEFSIIGISFNRDRKMGFVVLSTFMILIGCLVYLYLG